MIFCDFRINFIKKFQQFKIKIFLIKKGGKE